MKKRILGLLGICGLLGFGATKAISVNAEEIVEPATCTVVIEESEHGKIIADKTEGEIGEIVSLTVDNDFLYLVDFIKVNDTNLTESETTKGLYTFALVEGENKVFANFIVDQETLGAFSSMYQEAIEKDWTNLFSLENVITIVKWIFDGGILFVMIRTIIRDKKTAEKLETATRDTLNTLVPDTVKETVIANVKEVLEPVFTNLGSQMADVSGAVSSVVKCIALSQENTPESKQAIIEELSKVKISDATTLAQIKEYVNKAIESALLAKKETLAKLDNISKENKDIVTGKEENSYDGTSI